MHGEIISFEVEPDGEHVIMTVSDSSESGHITVRATKAELTAMADAQPAYSNGPPQTPTRRAGMHIRAHKGFSHGLAPGTDHDIGCASCIREQAADSPPVITGEERP